MSDATTDLPGWGQARWITADFGPVMPLFRRAFSLDGDVSKATLRICGLGQFELRINGRKVGDDVM
jgi:hypothetical protein